MTDSNPFSSAFIFSAPPASSPTFSSSTLPSSWPGNSSTEFIFPAVPASYNSNHERCWKPVKARCPPSTPVRHNKTSPSSTTPPFPSATSETEESIKPSSLQIVVVSKILKNIPQNPHFWSLKGYSEVARQSLIKAWDHIFEETVDQVLSMQVNGFWVDVKRLWETMDELQKMGYNVLVLRRRLVELTDILLSRKRHKSAIMRLKSKAEQHRMEKSRLDFEIVKLRARAEAEKANVEDVMAKVAKMEEEMPSFNVVFTELATKLL